MRIAIMQPYFLPYAGYFRLFQETDLFVVYDCVQFIRRGWIHRNRLLNNQGELSWITLPLVKAPRDIRISELIFPEDAKIRMCEQQNKFHIFKSPDYILNELSHMMTEFSLRPVNYITNLLKHTCKMLDLPFNISYSSQLQIPSDIHGQDRIITIAKHFNADVYINPPGGRDLYDKNDFEKHNIKLKFLPEYIGSYESILPRMFNESISIVRNEIISQGADT